MRMRIGNFARSGLSVSTCSAVLAGALALLVPGSAWAQCSTSAGGAIDVRGPYPSPNNSKIHLGETATIFSVGINNLNPGACDLNQLKAWVVYPNNSFQGFLDTVNLLQGTFIQCPGG